MMDYVDLVFMIMGITSIISVLFTFLAVRTKDLMYAVIFSSVQSIAYALVYFLLMAPDIVLVYVAVSVGIYPLILILIVKRVGRLEVTT